MMSSFLYKNILSLINQLDNASDTFYIGLKPSFYCFSLAELKKLRQILQEVVLSKVCIGRDY